MDDDRNLKLEERIAHLERALEEMSDTALRQEREIERLSRRVELLLAREAERETDQGGTVPLADWTPPHW
ncbi:SlyX protein [Maritimibacter sp. 55A14]|uniref:SlyX family protein n=1 Tax=Maritimibacter sp. 55A14 TaxID=2174844 RepID=UPI000D616EBA|nr:SlyX family protein [Maritimibacter sp. 55A14]PWE32090.1 SlyX protein [Maritimibacter sp. 55A14]